MDPDLTNALVREVYSWIIITLVGSVFVIYYLGMRAKWREG